MILSILLNIIFIVVLVIGIIKYRDLKKSIIVTGMKSGFEITKIKEYTSENTMCSSKLNLENTTAYILNPEEETVVVLVEMKKRKDTV